MSLTNFFFILDIRLNGGDVHKADKIRLIEFLRAAGVQSLDEKTDALNSRKRSFRENGVVLRVLIHYANSANVLFGTT